MAYTVERAELEALEPEWRELLPRATMENVFVSPTWLRTWWDIFGGGRELILLSVRKDGALVGVAPLMRDGEELSFAGDTRICDYMDFVTLKGEEEHVVTAVLRSLGEEPWRQLTLWAVPEGSPTLAALAQACGGLGLSVEVEVEDVCPRVELPPSWEEYVASLNKKDRHELRRKLRKLSQGGKVDLETLDEPAAVAASLDDFLRLYRESRSDKAGFMTEEMERFFRAIIDALASEGKVELVFLSLGGVRVAAVLCFRDEDETLLYNSGYHPDYAYLSVGLLSKALALQQAIGEGKARFDFLRGREPYKYDLGAKDLAVHRCVVRRG